MTQVLTNHTHTSTIHDASLDYYGRRLATCSSDKTIKLFTVPPSTSSSSDAPPAPQPLDTLKGHDAAVHSLAWAHPKFGSILASCGYDGKVIIWREATAPGGGQQPGQWQRVTTFALHEASANGVAWAPHELGAHLACVSSDGHVSVMSLNDSVASGGNAGAAAAGGWETQLMNAHETGANGVSWAPAASPGALTSAGGNANQAVQRRFVTGGSDCKVKIWEAVGGAPTAPGQQKWDVVATLSGHQGWVRDVAWSPSLLNKTYIASCGEDKTVRIWSLGQGESVADEGKWKPEVLEFESPVWRVSWSPSGNVLAVAGGDNRVTLWKERVRDGGWENVKTMDE